MGSHCNDCIRAGRLPALARFRRWEAAGGALVTKVLVAVSLLVFVVDSVSAAGGRSPVATGFALFGPAVASGDWYRLITSGFVHYGIFHLGFNMVLLYRFGAMLESVLGPVAFLALYLASALGGSFGAVLLSPTALTAGASGAVFGLVGATAVGMRRRGLDVWRSDVGGLLVLNLVLTFVVPGISMGGHLGGLLGGAAVGWASFGPRQSKRSASLGTVVAASVIALAGIGSVWVSAY